MFVHIIESIILANTDYIFTHRVCLISSSRMSYRIYTLFQGTHRLITHVHNNTYVHSSQHTNYSYLRSSSTVVMVELEPTAALKYFRPASVMLSRTVSIRVSNQQQQSTTRHKPSRPDAAAHRQHAFVIHIQNTYTPIKFTHTHIDQTHTHTNTRTRSCQHTNYSYLQESSTVVMVELEPTAALKCFRPASVMLSRPVPIRVSN